MDVKHIGYGVWGVSIVDNNDNHRQYQSLIVLLEIKKTKAKSVRIKAQKNTKGWRLMCKTKCAIVSHNDAIQADHLTQNTNSYTQFSP